MVDLTLEDAEPSEAVHLSLLRHQIKAATAFKRLHAGESYYDLDRKQYRRVTSTNDVFDFDYRPSTFHGLVLYDDLWYSVLKDLWPL